ncbi:MAG: hypothetical protein JXR58_08390, partial [Bacteroidales bacterium]|nr:hypothetical protein [Bacteroidales bacterium]
INANISATKKMYKCITLPDTILCVGYQFSIVGREFINELGFPQKNRILIAMGGGNYTDELIEMIEKIVSNNNYCFEIVSNDNRINRINGSNISLHINSHNTLNIYKKCAAAIVAGGITSFELAILNIPMLIVPFAENQYLNAMAWEKKKFGVNYKNPKNFLDNIKNKGLSQLIDETFEVQKLRKNTIKGKGAEKITKIILKQSNLNY